MDPKTLTAEVHDRLRYCCSTWPQNMREWLTIYRGFHGTAREVEQALETLVAAGHVERWDNVGLTCYTLRDNTRQRDRGMSNTPHFTLIDRAEHAGLSRYAAYEALCWAVGKTDSEIRAEMEWKRVCAQRDWQEVGCAHFDYTRAVVLGYLLEEER